MTTSAGPITDLLALQQLDTALDQLRHQRTTLPEREARIRAEAARAAIQGSLAELDQRRKAIAEAEERLERQLRDLDARTADLASKLQRTMVVREAEALMAEQRATSARRSEIEDEELALLEEDEGLEREQADRSSDLEQIERLVSDSSSELAAAEAVLAEQEGELLRQRDVAAATVPADLLARYEQLRARLGGVAVAELNGGRCSGCHLALSMSALERIRGAPADAWVECEECGRLLVR